MVLFIVPCLTRPCNILSVTGVLNGVSAQHFNIEYCYFVESYLLALQFYGTKIVIYWQNQVFSFINKTITDREKYLAE
jgi:hypothetical protein